MINTAKPLLLEVSEPAWTEAVERVGPWLATVAILQATYRNVLEDTAPDVHEPHLRAYLGDLLGTAIEHESQVEDLYRAFGIAAGPRRALTAVAPLVAMAREAIGHVEGLTAGAKGSNWRLLRELLLTNLDAISGYAVAEQLALALGNPEAAAIAFAIVEQKTEHQLLLREIFLEMAPNAILYGRDF